MTALASTSLLPMIRIALSPTTILPRMERSQAFRAGVSPFESRSSMRGENASTFAVSIVIAPVPCDCALQDCDLLAEEVVELGDAFGDRIVEPLELLFRRTDFALTRDNPVVDGSGTNGMPFGQRGERFHEPFRIEQLFLQCAADIVIEKLHADGVALARGRTLLGAAGRRSKIKAYPTGTCRYAGSCRHRSGRR